MPFVAVTDPKNARILLLSAAGLAALGLIVVVATVIWWRRSRVEHPVLGPLKVMGTARWTKATAAERARLAENARWDTADPAIGHVGDPARR